MIKFLTYDLQCRFCGQITGQYKYPDNLVVADLNIADIRCTQHEVEHGNFNQMAQEYMALGKTYDEFLTIMETTEYKKTNLDIEIVKIKPKNIPIDK